MRIVYHPNIIKILVRIHIMPVKFKVCVRVGVCVWGCVWVCVYVCVFQGIAPISFWLLIISAIA